MSKQIKKSALNQKINEDFKKKLVKFIYLIYDFLHK